MSILYHRLNHDDYNQSSFQSPFTTHVTNLQCAFKRVLENKFLKLMLLGLFLFNFAQGQVNNGDYLKPQEIIPPSPISYKISRYGGINTSLISGTPNISIPLLDYSVKNINLQLNLNYSSNGIKVDEVATRTGMGWNLLAGGTISRIVYDLPDENGMKLPVPTVFDASQSVYNFLQTLSQENSYDMQPDVYNFSFAGYGGKFIISNGVIKQIVKSNLKIESNVDGYDFRIITPDGTKYLFGGIGARESSKTGADCDRHMPSFPTTAWHLSKVISYTGESISLSYMTYEANYPLGVNETITKYRRLEDNGYCANNPNLFNDGYARLCVSKLATYYCALSEITSNLGGRIKFSYINRSDLPGERLLSRIRYFSGLDTASVDKYVNLTYVYSQNTGYGNVLTTTPDLTQRAFLSSIEEGSGVNTPEKKHAFFYDDIDGLPTRLSFAQDIYGYFNGKPNLNHIVPNMIGNPSGFPSDLANRSIDFNYAKKGLLTKIKYPTGGQDSIVYEPNYVFTEIKTKGQILKNNISGVGIGIRSAQIHRSPVFLTQLTHTAKINILCNYQGGINNYLPNYNFVKVAVFDQGSSKVVFERSHTDVGENISDDVPLIAGHQYFIQLTVYGVNVFGSVELNYQNQGDVTSMQNVIAPGLRVQKFITTTKEPFSSSTKRFFYTTPSSGYIQSSGVASSNPEFYVNIEDGAKCVGKSGGVVIINGYYDGLYSYAINTQYLQQTPVQYKVVTVSDGDNFENGADVHEFKLYSDVPGEPIFGQGVSGAPLSNYGLMNGLETKVTTLRKKNDVLMPVKMVETSYKESNCNDFGQLTGSSCISTPEYGYVVKKNYDTDWGFLPANEALKPFHATRYKIIGSWFYPDTIKTTVYDPTGNNHLVEHVINKYENLVYPQLTSSITYTSNQKTSEISYLYPYDNTSLAGSLTSNQIGALKMLVASNRISSPVQTLKKINGVEVERTRIDFKDWGNSIVLPNFYKASFSGDSLITRIGFYSYDSDNGNLRCQSKIAGPLICIIWSYNGKYPIAEIKNSDYQAVENILGATAIKNFSNLSSPDKATVDAFLAPLKTNLPNAQITTYTYKPLVGMTSMTDAKGMTTYYEYDAFGRLRYVKDQNGNILKSNDYHYKN